MTTQTRVSTWTIDGAHSVVEFAVKHMMVATVKGRFRDVSGTIEIDDANHELSSVHAEIDAASIDTGQEQRDAHPRSADFFDAEQFPHLTFTSTRVEKLDAERARVSGDLTMHGITNEVVLDVELDGQGVDAYGQTRAAFTATTTVNRRDFGLNWNGVIEAGGVVVQDKVKITLHIAATTN